ncbi:MAG: tandem-95 repeat protein [Pirellulaceae bacterium]|nr:tandem-95 repeat protein [Pirellulaceae bacterium]
MSRSLNRKPLRSQRGTGRKQQVHETRRRRFLSHEALEGRLLLAGDVAGTVYDDLNGNGLREQEEKGISNWTVYLDLNQDGAPQVDEPSARTDQDGDYLIPSVAPGDYRVAEVVRSGWVPTSPASGYADISLRDGEEAKVDFLNQGSGGTGSLSGTVWNDVIGDGIRDAMDIGLAGWTIFLDLNGDGLPDPAEPSAETDGDGNYLIEGLAADEYEVVEVLPLGWDTSPGFSDGYSVVVADDANSVVPDFANYTEEISIVRGVVWSDANANGVLDAGEPGLTGWRVYSDLNANGVLDVGEPSAFSGTGGSYVLVGLKPGANRITEEVQASFRPTSPSTGFRTVTAPNSGTLNNINFGNQERTDAAIGGVVFNDRDQDGVRDPGENGLPGITIYLDRNNNDLLDLDEPSVTTAEDLFYTPDVDEAGTYQFTHLAKGSYVVREIVPSLLAATPESERSHVVTVGPADDVRDVNSANVYRPSEIHGTKFEDLNGNHLRDDGEPGIEGATIFIDLDRDDLYDDDEPMTLTAADGSYSFVNLPAGAYVVRERVAAGYVQTFPQTRDGVLWPAGVSNPAVGNVTPLSIEASLAEGQTHSTTVSLTLPTTGGLTNLVDVFLLFDDTGSFTSNSPIVRAAFPEIIATLQSRLPGIDFGFGTGRFEEYGNFAGEYASGRPFVLNQPIVATDVPGFSGSIQAALDRVAPGYGGDGPETDIEALYQLVTGAGFDGNNNGSVLDSGPAGLASTQVTPGNSGDVPSFASFTADPTHQVLPATGTIGGAGFRAGALPIIITATDIGFAYQPKGETTITGIDGLTLPLSQVTASSRATTPFNSGAGVQETVTGLNALGALVIGLGTNAASNQAPRQGLEALANLTGSVNRSTTTIANGTTDDIAPGDPFYFQIGTGTGLALHVADGIVAAVENAVTNVNVNVTLRASDPRVLISSRPGVINGLGAGDTATFDVTFVGDGRPHRFDLEFVREGTNVVLGSIPVVIGTPIPGDGYEFEDCDDGEHSSGIDFGDQRIGDGSPNVAPSFTAGADQVVQEDAGTQTVPAWATDVLAGPTSESSQSVNFLVSSDNPSLFAEQPAISPNGTLTYVPAPDAFGLANVTVRLHDNGGTDGGGVDTSLPQTFTITITPVNDAPLATADSYTTGEDVVLMIDAPGVLGNDSDPDSSSLAAVLVTGPTHGSLTLNANGSFSYTPDAGYSGVDSFSYKSSDATADSNLATASITITPVNDAPLAAADSYTTGEDAVLIIDVPGVLGNDSDPDSSSLTAVQATGPTPGSLTLNANGSFSYTHDAGYSGVDSFSYKASDGTADSNVATASITITPANDPPLATADSYTTGEDAVPTIDGPGVLGNDSDPDSSSLTAVLVTGPTHGSLTLNTNGSFSYTPDAGYSGVDSFSYKASDGTADSNVATASIQVEPAPQPAGAKFFVVDRAVRRTFGYDADGKSLSISRLNTEDKKPRGIAAAADGTTLWVVDEKGEVFVYDNQGQSLGSWEFGMVDKAEGITIHGDDLWIVDGGERQVHFFAGGATRRSGNATPTSSFRLDSSNRNPMDLVTDGSHVWVVNDTRAADQVFRYTISGVLDGEWQIGEPNSKSKPTGLTIDPNDVNHIWIVDSGSDKVYQYDGATSRTTGVLTASHIFKLARINRDPQGIADPRPFIESQAGRSASDNPADDLIMTLVGRADEGSVHDERSSTDNPGTKARRSKPADSEFRGEELFEVFRGGHAQRENSRHVVFAELRDRLSSLDLDLDATLDELLAGGRTNLQDAPGSLRATGPRLL